ncbi:NAD(P)H-dependent FMN reductase [Stackebrandtia endophytica]|uniref:NAD(P)H-dependent FMN reductase n=1 Tax=Stackebrandtia endophytica TaxID=1496996 RepID=A0A543B0Z9_9ACTN|nr:NAD(P)H-dependent oxidoreductase [Stackebrandtia endophytica]TQL78502.1 NAD(P)H-dependent FMN reductase [Stackebrandtia endophytica]
MKLHIVISSTRPGRLGGHIGQWFYENAKHHNGFEARLVDLAEVNLPFLDEPEHPSTGRYVHEHSRQWSSLVDEADAFVFVTPEYNYGMPASLKNALDFLYHEWSHKPVGFVSYGGVSAGTRGVQMTKQVVTTLRMYPIGATVAIPTRQYVENGELRADQALNDSAASMLAELAIVSAAMAPMRAA